MNIKTASLVAAIGCAIAGAGRLMATGAFLFKGGGKTVVSKPAGTAVSLEPVEETPSVPGGDILPVQVGGVSFNLRWCPAGSFTMGSTNGYSDEKPQHQVTLSQGFWLGETEVTQGLWREITGKNPSDHKVDDEYPVENVSWDDCQEFLEKLNDRAEVKKAGIRFALPTEAQWEYACRAGTTGDYGGTGKLDDMGWYGERANGATHPVARKEPNAWGLYDMHGNVWEWSADWYDSGYYAKSPASDPTGPASGGYRVLRGGCFWNDAQYCHSALRRSYGPDDRRGNIGFRLLARQDAK